MFDLNFSYFYYGFLVDVNIVDCFVTDCGIFLTATFPFCICVPSEWTGWTEWWEGQTDATYERPCVVLTSLHTHSLFHSLVIYLIVIWLNPTWSDHVTAVNITLSQTHYQTLFSRSNYHILSLALSYSQTHFYNLTHYYTLIDYHTHTHTIILSHTLSYTLTHTLSYSLTHNITLPLRVREYECER